MKRISLDTLLRARQDLTYQEQYRYICSLLEAGQVKPVKTSKMNGKKPALYREYRYLELGEGYLLDRDKILTASQRKLKELEEMRRSLEKEEDTLTKEYQGLTSGKVLELPEELERELENLDIHAVYGMEWLKRNGYSQKKNRELVRNNPFLPYALILSGQELEKLGRSDKNICTSFPVPIVEREKIEEIQEK